MKTRRSGRGELGQVPARVPGAGAERAHPLARLHHAIGNRAVTRILTDRGREHEADRIAADVVQGRAAPRPASARDDAPPARAGSAPLPDDVRGEMERGFGTDFRGVRVHAGDEAAESAHALGAQAYTIGNDIVFARGSYEPQRTGGKQLLAHELAHVVQQRATGPALQRKEAEPSPTQAIDFDVGPLHIQITTLEQLLAASRLIVAELESDLVGLEGATDVRTAAEEWIAKVQRWQPYLQQHAADTLDPLIGGTARRYLAEAGAIRKQIAIAKYETSQVPVREQLRLSRKRAEEAAAEAIRMRPRVLDGLRAAYRKEKPSHIKEWAEILGVVTAAGNDMHELAEQITEALFKSEHAAEEAKRLLILDPLAVHPTAVVMELKPAVKLAEGLEHLAKALAAVNLAFVALDSEKKPTEIEEAMHQVERATSAFGELTVLLGMAPHIGLYMHLYLVPMTKKIIEMLGHLVDQLHEVNKDWVELTGEFGYPGAEPGSRKLDSTVLFSYMKRVMRAASAEDVPAPSSAVIDYLVDHREAIDAAVGEEHELPTTGWWWWRSLDKRRGIEWLFENRDMLWAVLYGSMRSDR